jgi:hypothetical protein
MKQKETGLKWYLALLGTTLDLSPFVFHQFALDFT